MVLRTLDAEIRALRCYRVCSHLAMHTLRTLAVVVLILGATEVGYSSAVFATTRRRAAPKEATKDLAESFQEFCAEWMQKVWTREPPAAKWEQDGDSVKRAYVEYSRDYSCQLTDGHPPVGKITYRETWYEQHGKTLPEAEASAPQPIKILETGEFFSYSRGRWDY